MEEAGNFGDRAFVIDFELTGGAVAGGRVVEFNAAALDGEVEVVGSGPGVSAGVGLGSGRDVGHAKGKKGVAQGGGFAG